MTIKVVHTKVSTIPDGDDSSLIRPSDWNADHSLEGLGTMAEQNANAVAITGGTISGVTIPASNLTGVVDVPHGGTGATTLTGYVKGTGTTAMTASSTIPNTDITGLGTASTKDAGVALGVATLDAGGTVPLSQIPASLIGGLNYQGAWNANTNTPTLTSSVGTKGYYYAVSVAGTTNLNGITDWQVGDLAVYSGTAWQKIDNTDAVTSVNGYTGTVVLTNTDISGFGTMSTQNANSVAITGGAIDGTAIGNTTRSSVKATTIDATGAVTLPASTTSLVPLHFASGVQPTTPIQGDTWSESTGLYFHNSAYTNQLNLGSNAAGTLENPTITVTGSGATIDVSSVRAVLFSLPQWVGDYKEYVIPAATGLALTDNSANYLIVSYNSGSPVYSITTNPALITNSDVVGATLLWRAGTQVHYQAINWGLSTASRINRRLVQTDRYQRATGLSLGESTGRVITLTAGNVWYGVSEIIEGAVTSASSNADFYYHVAGVWNVSTVSTYNNTQYDNGTNLVATGGANYTVNWVYRYLDGSGLPKLAYVLGTANYNLAQAQASTVPTPPPILSTMAILVGRIIVVHNGTTATQIDSAFTQVFASSTVTDHNDLGNLQGGTTNEYYHLTSAEYTGTGTGTFVRASSPTLTSPNLDTPTVLIGTNITGTGASFTAGNATKLSTGRTIAITGDLAYTSPSFDGSGNVTAAGTLATVNSNVGSFTNASVTVNGKGLVTAVSSGTAPVTSVGATSPVVSSGGTTPTISMPAATGSVNGYLTSTDWTTFNNKQPAGSYLTAVTADAPLSGSGTSGSHLVISQATTSTNGYLSSTDWNTFNGKAPATTYTTNYIPYGQGTTTPNQSSGLQYNGTYLLVGTTAVLGGLTNPISAATGNANNYIQKYIYNANNGVSASSDVVAYANNSTDAHGWADMGFTSQSYADTTYTVTGPNEAYLFGSAPSGSGKTGNLVYATDNTGTENVHQFYVGGFTQAKSAWKAKIDANGLSATQVNATNGIIVNSKTVAASYSIPSGSSAMSTGPMTVASGQTVTVASGSRWVIL